MSWDVGCQIRSGDFDGSFWSATHQNSAARFNNWRIQGAWCNDCLMPFITIIDCKTGDNTKQFVNFAERDGEESFEDYGAAEEQEPELLDPFGDKKTIVK